MPEPAERSDEEVRAEVVAWLRDNLPAGWVEALEAGDDATVQRLRMEQDYGDWCRRLGEAGWATPTWPRRYSGAGLGPRQAAVVNEELSRHRVARSFNVIGLGMAGPTILRWGSDELKRRYLPALARHQEIWCQLFSEPGAGSDVAGLATRAVRDGDAWIVNGQKSWTSLAQFAAFGLLLARTEPDQPKHRGLTYFVLDMKAPGVDVRPLRQMTGDSEFNEVFLTDVRIDDRQRLGDVNEGWAVATTTLMNERVALSDLGGGGTENRLGGPVDLLLDAARASGAWDDPALRDRLMRAYVDGRIARMNHLRVNAAREAGRQPGPEGSITKLFLAEYNQRLQDLAVDLLGSGGAAWEADDWQSAETVRRFLRSRANTIEGGTSEIMRNILGERVLGLPKEPAVDRDIPWKDVRRSG